MTMARGSCRANLAACMGQFKYISNRSEQREQRKENQRIRPSRPTRGRSARFRSAVSAFSLLPLLTPVQSLPSHFVFHQKMQAGDIAGNIPPARLDLLLEDTSSGCVTGELGGD
jgi:hypothetical protein